MSTGDELRRSRFAAAGFVALLALSVFWPSPLVSANRLWLNKPLAVDELSFLGREAPAWDAAYWCLAGLFLLALLQSGRPDVTPLRDYRSLRPSLPRRFWIGVIATVLIVSAVWLLADRVLIGVAEGIQSDWSEAFIRIINRFGGGMNPPMIVLFFLIAGLVYRRRTWIAYSVAMALAGLGAGLFAQILKFIVGRTRPELWLGPFHYARGGANSFPSGHTVGAFALAGVLLFASRSIPLRVIAITLATAVGAARIMAFRHWPSDVVASAAIGLLAAAAATSSVMTLTSASRDNSYSAARE